MDSIPPLCKVTILIVVAMVALLGGIFLRDKSDYG
jgi:hypothetical protein